MAGKVVEHNFDDVMQIVKTYISNPKNLALIRKAYHYADKMHAGQTRKSGSPYISHPIEVAYILAGLNVGPKTIAAAFLHDVIEDCGATKEDFLKEFDEEVFTLVEGVTKIGNIEFKDEKEYQAANHRKILIAMARDIRVILIKLVDRLHNMRTLQFRSVEKQKKIAEETRNVYAPIAHRLGISEIKNELEDLCFYFLEREQYYEIARMVEVRRAERDEHVNKMIHEISNMLAELQIPFRIFGRSKHLYSIYKKMTTKHKRFDEILDLLAIRVITDTEMFCYEVLGYIHQSYRPIPGRLKDYIAMPKMNMYQSLHTTVVGNEGSIFEVQIRTELMDSIAEQGVAAHWRYKEGNRYNAVKEQKEIEEKLSWFKDLSNIEDESGDDDQEFMDALKKDLFEANVYVMSPKGRVIDLPNGSTPIDFAYRIHTEVGHSTIGAIVNNTLVPINTVLKTGDVVQLRTSKQSAGPSEDWLKFVKTSHARNKIRGFLTRKESEVRDPIIEKGEQLLKEELIRREVDLDQMSGKKLEQLYSQMNFNNANDFFYALGNKAITINSVLNRISNKKSLLENLNISRNFVREQPKKTVSKFGVSVAGIDSVKIQLAGCCSPVLGDEIVGYITKGQGVRVHRQDCPNIIQKKQRLVEVSWDESGQDAKFDVVLYIESMDRNFLLTDLVTVISQYKAGLNAINSEVNEDKVTATTTVKITVNNVEHLRNIMANLRKVDSVIKVERAIQ